MTDTIADYLTRIRNGQKAHHRIIDIPSSNLKKRITEILFDKGYIKAYKFEETESNQGNIKIALKYNSVTDDPIIRKLERVSKLGRRRFVKARQLPRVLNGLGIAIISTSHGVMTNKEALEKKLGGEVVCYVY